MAGNGGAVGAQTQQATPGGFTPSTDPVNPAMQPYGNSLFNNPNAGGRSPGQPGYAAGMQKPTVNPHTGQPIDPAKVNFGGHGPNWQPPAQQTYTPYAGQFDTLGQDIQRLQQGFQAQPGMWPQMGNGGGLPAQGAVSGAIGGALSGMSPQTMGGNAPYSGMGFTGQPPLAALPQQWQQAQMPMINSMPWANPFLMAMLANYGGMR